MLLSGDNHRQLYIPKGFAHGFLVLSDYAKFCYKCDEFYHPEDEGGLMWNDSIIGIRWPALEGEEQFDETLLTLSNKDLCYPNFNEVVWGE